MVAENGQGDANSDRAGVAPRFETVPRLSRRDGADDRSWYLL